MWICPILVYIWIILSVETWDDSNTKWKIILIKQVTISRHRHSLMRWTGGTSQKRWEPHTSDGCSSSCSFWSSSELSFVLVSCSGVVSSSGTASLCGSISSLICAVMFLSLSECESSCSVSSPRSVISKPSRDNRLVSSPILLIISMLSSRVRTGAQMLTVFEPWFTRDCSRDSLLRQSMSSRERNKAPSIPSRGSFRLSRTKGLALPIKIKF